MGVGQDRMPPRADIGFPLLEFRIHGSSMAMSQKSPWSPVRKGRVNWVPDLCACKTRIIPWTVRYDEVLLVVEGEITIQTDQGDLVAGPKRLYLAEQGHQACIQGGGRAALLRDPSMELGGGKRMKINRLPRDDKTNGWSAILARRGRPNRRWKPR